jgi:hypothetical protein
VGDEPTAIQLRVDSPSRQRRLTVLLRLLLIVPHVVVLNFLQIAFGAVGIVAWFAALFTRRNPVATFMAGVMRWQARVQGYVLLLTDRYPPFSLEPAEYPVTFEAAPTTFSRLSVLFRFLLAIPAFVVAAVVGAGLAVLGVVAWLITILLGRLPAPLHGAFAATLRFNLRVSAYLYLVQSAYPRGLFGDPVSLSELPTTATVAYDAETGQYVTAAAPEPVDPTPPDEPAPAPSGLASLRPMPAVADEPRVPASWPLRVGRGAKRLLVVEIVLGVVVIIAYIVGAAALSGSLRATLWSASYRHTIVGFRAADVRAEAATGTASPSWSEVSSACSALSTSTGTLATIPLYPDTTLNQRLERGIGDAFRGAVLCQAAVSSRQASELSQAHLYLARGDASLSAFLSAIP